jgi:phosphoenolpyruvate carboxykinase (ATP)
VYPKFNLSIPKACPGVPSEILNPCKTWLGTQANYDATLAKLATLFKDNFKLYEDKATADVVSAGPK